VLRRFAAIVREHARELATLDAIDCGNPVRAMVGDAEVAALQIDFFAGLVTEMKGASIPMGPGRMNVSVREPLGVVARIIPFNHPFMFAAGKSAAPLAAGNTVVVKPPEQAPLSALRLAELVEDVFPPGVFNVVTGAGRDTGVALVAHPDVAKVALIGSVAAGRAVAKSAAERLLLGGNGAVEGIEVRTSAKGSGYDAGVVDLVLSEAKEKGILRAHGCSCHTLEALEAAAADPWVEVDLARFNPWGMHMDNRKDEPKEKAPDYVKPVLAKMRKAGKGVIGMKILAQGDMLKAEDRLARARESLRFALGSGVIDMMVIGFESPKQITEILGETRVAVAELGLPYRV